MPIEEIEKFLHEDLNKSQISPEAIAIIEKVHRSEDLSEQELDMFLNASETAAVLSIKHHKPISRKYVKELARNFVNKETGHVTPARIKNVRVIGTSHLYKARDVLAVRMSKPKPRQQIS